MKLAIVGSRTFNDYKKLEKEVNAYCPREELEEIISGGAKGADSLAEQYACEYGIDLNVIKASWRTYGKQAGYMRNVVIIEQADQVIAFWDGESKGTKHTIDTAKKAGKPVFIVNIKP